ncbi:hypothetical protein B0T26DRAFT_673425 [Lasiosphaeria miniovina]|uniref:Uncharacterized protein n=1 Tax=Lasiosphaeria miniovina TaxID=1954250 RepID=A0AA40DZN9_9PEZI|nr:uncharacterized protein B0T26DRAFT_673425 [Lasiosphaeria miniovina]KAK0721625.1 hypothetical protein B0T26DRAFT_673425 [Lasiosphaeria miniovina]
MRFSIAPSLLSLPLLAAAVAAYAGVNHQVTVGKDAKLVFDPPTLSAAPGDTVTYSFFAKNHSVTQSSFAQPCQPLAGGGFFSAFTPNPATDGSASPTTFTITINDTKPIWAYCGQTNGDHCQKGMVHAINAPTSGTNTFQAFSDLALKASTPSGSPPDGLPVGGLRKLSVIVGFNGTLTYSPNNITAPPRTVIEFSYNPKNHTVTQSSFDSPCQPLDKGFSSGFIPTAVSPSGVTFDIVVPDTNPIWFYCGQIVGTHCQKGMVGSINAATSGAKTLEAYIAKAATAPPSTIPPQAPLGGTITVNGTVITSFNGNSLQDATIPPPANPAAGNASVPAPGTPIDPYYYGMAGGSQPSNYGWGSSITDTSVALLAFLLFIEDVQANLLFEMHSRLDNGSWSSVYPRAIVNTLGSMAAQTLVQRSTTSDCLTHFKKPLGNQCSFKLPTTSVDDFLAAALKLNLLAIGALIDGITQVPLSDSYLLAPLASTIGSKGRMTAVINMMQNHLAAAAPREAVMPVQLAWSYVITNYVSDPNCPTKISGMPGSPYPALTVTDKQVTPDQSRTTAITVSFDSSASGDKWVAWMGAWGDLEFTPLAADKTTTVPADLYGHVWIAVVSKKDVAMKDVPGVTVAGPEIVWVSQP